MATPQDQQAATAAAPQQPGPDPTTGPLAWIDFEVDHTDPSTGAVTTVPKHAQGVVTPDGKAFVVAPVERDVELRDALTGRVWTERRTSDGLVPLAQAHGPTARLRGAGS